VAEGRLVIIALGNEEYGLPIEYVREITRLGDIRSIPDAPEYIKGLINIRGQAIPLIDLHLRFGTHTRFVSTDIGCEVEHNGYALISEYKNSLVALSVDEVREVRAIDDVDECPQMIHVPYISGIVNLPNRIIMKLDLELMLKDCGMDVLITEN
jgi:purine-binding chemotaxis protein CheW